MNDSYHGGTRVKLAGIPFQDPFEVLTMCLGSESLGDKCLRISEEEFSSRSKSKFRSEKKARCPDECDLRQQPYGFNTPLAKLSFLLALLVQAPNHHPSCGVLERIQRATLRGQSLFNQIFAHSSEVEKIGALDWTNSSGSGSRRTHQHDSHEGRGGVVLA